MLQSLTFFYDASLDTGMLVSDVSSLPGLLEDLQSFLVKLPRRSWKLVLGHDIMSCLIVWLSLFFS